MNDTTLDFTGLLEPQIPHSIKLLNSLHLNGIALDNSHTGTGKTHCASWIVKQLNVPIVVICPKSVMNKWKTTLESFGIKATIIINYEKLVRGNSPYLSYRKESNGIDPKTGKTIQLSRYQLVTINLPAGCVVICDEFHKCGGVTSLSCGMAIALKQQGYKALALSATLATSVLNMRATGYVANLHNLYSWKQWCLDNGAEEVGKWGAITVDVDGEKAQNRMKEIHGNLFGVQEIASRLTREDMGDLFPENIISAEIVDLESNDPKIRAVYDKMEDEICKLDEDSANYSAHIFAIMMAARRKAEMLKVPIFQEMFEDWYDEGISPVVFLNFTESIEALGSRLDKKRRYRNKIGFIYGKQSMAERNSYIERFRNDTLRGMINNTKSGGASIDLNDVNGKHPRGTLINPSWSAVDMLQCLGRIDRTYTLTKCLQRFLFAANCIEEKIAHRMQRKIHNLSCLNAGDLNLNLKFL